MAAISGNTAYIQAIDRLWNNVAVSKLYLTGGIGARHAGEAFGDDYELPNDSAYNETCASVANALWNHRMFLLHGESKHIDVLERVLYNGFLSGVALEGDKFLYGNPLTCKGGYERSPWFGCACCPANVARFLPSIPGYLYATKGEDLYVNLFIGSSASFKIQQTEIRLEQQTLYPWDGRVQLTVHSPEPKSFRVNLRIPGWVSNRPVPSDLYSYADHQATKEVLIKINNSSANYVVRNGYAALERAWSDGDVITIDMPMEARRVIADEKVPADRGCEAYERGPVVFCFEAIDNDGDVFKATVQDKDKIEYAFVPKLLGGVGTLRFNGHRWLADDPNKATTAKDCLLTAIPFYAWAHRGPSAMTVWLPSAMSKTDE